ncbi:MAG: arsenate-mycothiol transferase ArsC [Candidatus Helarchaeota archaeon]
MEQFIITLKQKQKINVLFICSGNIIRSVMAEFLFKRAINELGINPDKFAVSSGAVLFKNSLIDPLTKKVLLNDGFPLHLIENFKPTYLKNKSNFHLLENADLIIAMENSHIRLIPRKFRFKTFLLTELDQSISLPDPFGLQLNIYNDMYIKIKSLIYQLIDRLI